MDTKTIHYERGYSKTVDLREEALYALCKIVLNNPTNCLSNEILESYDKLYDFMKAMEEKHARSD